MDNFARVGRLALRLRGTFVVAVTSALAVGVLWGGNISAIGPFLEIATSGKSPRAWVADRVEKTEATITAFSDEVRQLESATADDESTQRSRSGELSAKRVRLEAARDSLEYYRWIQPYVIRFLPDSAFQTLVLIVGLLVLGTIIKGLFLIAQSIAAHRLAQRATFDLRKQFFRRTLRMDLANLGVDANSDRISRFTYDMENLSAGLQTLFGKAIREPLKMAACLIGAGWICWRLLLISLVIAPLAAFLIRKLAKSLRRANRRAMEEMAQIYSRLNESLEGIKIVKAFTMERHERRRFHGSSKKYYFHAMRIALYDSLSRPMTELLGIFTIGLALLAGAHIVLNKETHLLGIRICNQPLSFSELVMFYGLLAGISDPARKLSEVFSRLQRAAAASDRIYQMMDRESRINDVPNPRPLVRHHRDLVFRDVSFSYAPGVPVLDKVNLRIERGETVALVGPNGCGKTTLANLIPRFFDPTTGSVELDGIDLRQVRRRDLRRQIGLVTQDTMLFDDTVLNNIRYGAPQATYEQVVAAAEQSHADRFIRGRLANGYQTMVGSRGGDLSGGQRQRIALARAILRDPAILILDEATSQIDLESEQVIHQVLKQFILDRTTVIITHRMSTLSLADRIVVMDSGSILDVGTHDQLVGRCTLYARLCDIQFKVIA